MQLRYPAENMRAKGVQVCFFFCSFVYYVFDFNKRIMELLYAGDQIYCTFNAADMYDR